MTIKEATKILKNLNLNLYVENGIQEIDKENTIIKEQIPKNGIKAYEETKIIVRI